MYVIAGPMMKWSFWYFNNSDIKNPTFKLHISIAYSKYDNQIHNFWIISYDGIVQILIGMEPAVKVSTVLSVHINTMSFKGQLNRKGSKLASTLLWRLFIFQFARLILEVKETTFQWFGHCLDSRITVVIIFI